MLRIYSFAGKMLYLVARPFVRAYFSGRPNKRVRIVVMNDRGQILLIKGWFSAQRWDLPGGGIAHREKPGAAAVRELREETGIGSSQEQLQMLGEFKHVDSASPFTVVLYLLKLQKKELGDSEGRKWEIIAQKWFSTKKLPQNINPMVSRALQRVSEVD